MPGTGSGIAGLVSIRSPQSARLHGQKCERPETTSGVGGAVQPASARRLCMIMLAPSPTAVLSLLPLPPLPLAPVALSCMVHVGLQSGCLIWNATLLRLSGSDHVIVRPSHADGEEAFPVMMRATPSQILISLFLAHIVPMMDGKKAPSACSRRYRRGCRRRLDRTRPGQAPCLACTQCPSPRRGSS